MEIKRKFELSVTTNRRFVIRQSSWVKQLNCEKCGQPMLVTEQAANFFGITQRRIFRIIEAEAAHFSESEAGAVMICITSLAEVFDSEQPIITANVVCEERRRD